jgi:DNA-binding NarL/FixJ family response regulator
MIRLALLDDHPAVLAGLRRLIEHEPDLLIVGAAPSAPQLARQLGETTTSPAPTDWLTAGVSRTVRIRPP